jgi:hypothetical protein
MTSDVRTVGILAVDHQDRKRLRSSKAPIRTLRQGNLQMPETSIRRRSSPAQRSDSSSRTCLFSLSGKGWLRLDPGVDPHVAGAPVGGLKRVNSDSTHSHTSISAM